MTDTKEAKEHVGKGWIVMEMARPKRRTNVLTKDAERVT